MVRMSLSKSAVARLEEELSRARQLNNFRLYMIAQSLLWLFDGKSVREIAGIYEITPKTIYDWLWKFMSCGFSWLLRYRYKGRGRTSRLTKAQKQNLYEMIAAGPEACGFNTGVWNTAMIAELIFSKFGVKYNPRYLSSLLKKSGLSYQKAKFITDRTDDEEWERQRKERAEIRWPQILKEAKEKGAVILFGDEASFAMRGSLAGTWAPEGKQPVVKTTGIRKGLKIFGAMEFKSGKFQYMESLSYKITTKSLTLIKDENIPEIILNALKKLKNQMYKTENEFISALEKEAAGCGHLIQSKEKILKYTENTGKFNSENYVKFLKQVLGNFSSHVILIEDGAPYHNGKAVKDFQEECKERLTVHRLPTFSPDYNPIEKLWKNTKRDATHLKYFKTFEELRESTVTVFKSYMEDAIKVISVMKKLRTEAGITDSV